MRAPAWFRATIVSSHFLMVLAADRAGLEAQEAAVLEITVLAAAGAQRLEGAHVAVRGTGLSGITDREGKVRIAGLPAGTRQLEVQLLGHTSVTRAIDLSAGVASEITVELTPAPIELAGVNATAPRSNLALRGFYDRKRSGNGTFLTSEDIDRMRPRYLSDVLRRVGGVQLGGSPNGSPRAQIRGQQTISGACPIQYFVDGVMAYGYNIDDTRPDDVDGIEIYRGAASVPADYKRGTATCGVILLWTRVRDD